MQDSYKNSVNAFKIISNAKKVIKFKSRLHDTLKLS